MNDPDAQLKLLLPPSRRWGGRRVRAGRKPGPRPHMRHRARAALSPQTPCHVTLRVRRGLPSLRDGRVVGAVERAFRAGCERGDFRLVEYSIQRDHLHLLVEADGTSALARGMKSLGTRLALAVNRMLRRRGPVLADRFHHRALRTPREVRNALAYVLLNFRKHAAAARSAPAQRIPAPDPASSGRWFAGGTRAPSPPAASPPVAPARTWLLRVGWRRHGRIDPCEIPAQRR